jgi:hypothetical protein
VTLAPYVIALGPNPPNMVDFQNQRDVLIRCAKLRSSTLDKLNLIDYMLDPKHMNEFEFIPPPAGPDLPGLQAALAGDLDVIADAASFAINNVKEAREPETYMAEIEHVPGFRLTALPPNLPRHTGPVVALPPNAMPNLVGMPAAPLISLLSCVNMEGVDHCLGFLGAELDPLGTDARPLADFFFLVLRSGATPEVRGDPNPPGAVIRSQFPPVGVEVTPGAVFIIEA